MSNGNDKPLRWGITRAYIEDIRDNIRFEDSRIESLDFDVVLGVTGIVAQPTRTIRIHPEYLFAMRRIQAQVQDPAANPANIALITFQIRENGRGEDVFSAPQRLGKIIPGTGTGHMEWDTPYVFREGAEISCIYAIDAVPGSGLPGWVAPDKLVTVSLIGDLVRKKILP